jgi:hypothetical protein
MMTRKTAGQIKEIGGRIEQFAGAKVRREVMAGSEKAAAASSAETVALWLKEAMDRLDAIATPVQSEK